MWNYLYNFSYIYEVLKRFALHNFNVEIRDVYIFLTSGQLSKISELGYICAIIASFKVTYFA